MSRWPPWPPRSHWGSRAPAGVRRTATGTGPRERRRPPTRRPRRRAPPRARRPRRPAPRDGPRPASASARATAGSWARASWTGPSSPTAMSRAFTSRRWKGRRPAARARTPAGALPSPP
ncbi:hypothetical protein DVH02_00260 [Streptomyces corynorhini]|uniref:Uncharacterized protein n=1 Tax=Streptomyces corynorhini TaxID=2282652 RepID=A0A370BEK6_9ACTN|nr:hypothetical protein DVH02_00260 [Streptomyces corynorhini]